MSDLVLLDTCALLWIAEGEKIADLAKAALDALWRRGEAPRVSTISAWEIGLLTARGRLSLPMSPGQWWARATDRLAFKLIDLTPDLMIGSSFLPGRPPDDPADRILAATARELGYSLMTRDAKLLDYATAGHLQAIAC